MIPPVVAELRANFGDFKAKVVDARGEWAKTTEVIRGSAAETAVAGSQHQKLAHSVHGGTSAFHLFRESSREAMGTVVSGVGAALPGVNELRAKIGETAAALRMQREVAREAYTAAVAGAKATQVEIARLNTGILATERQMLLISPASSAFTRANDKVMALRAQIHGLEADLAASAAAMKANSGSTLGAVAGKGKIVAAGGAAAGIAAAVVVTYHGAKEALKEQASLDSLRLVIEKTKRSWQEYREPLDSVLGQMRALGFTDVETAHSLEWLTRITGNSEKALNLAGMAANVARAKHIDLASATTLVAKVANGKVTALGKMGLATKDAAGNTLTAKAAMDKLTKAFGGAADAYSHTLKGQLAELKAQTGHVFAAIGNRLIPVMERAGEGFRRMAGWVRTHVLPPLRALALWFNDRIAPALRKVTTILRDGLEKAFNKVTDALDKNQSQVSRVREVLKTVAEFVAEKVLPILAHLQVFLWDQLAGALSHIITAIGKVVDAFEWMYVFLAKLPNRIVTGFLQPVINKMLDWAKAIVGAADSAFGWVPIMGGQLDNARNAINSFATSTAATLQSWADTTAAIGYAAGQQVGTNFAAGINGGARAAVSAPRVKISRVNISSGYSRGLSNAYTGDEDEKKKRKKAGAGGGAKKKKDSAAAAAAAAKKRAAAALAKKKAREAAARAKKKQKEALERAVAAAKKAAAAVIAHLKAELAARNEIIRAMQVQAKLSGQAAQDLSIVNGNVLNRGSSFQQTAERGRTTNVFNIAGNVWTTRELSAAVTDEQRRAGRNNSVGFAA